MMDRVMPLHNLWHTNYTDLSQHFVAALHLRGHLCCFCLINYLQRRESCQGSRVNTSQSSHGGRGFSQLPFPKLRILPCVCLCLLQKVSERMNFLEGLTLSPIPSSPFCERSVSLHPEQTAAVCGAVQVEAALWSSAWVLLLKSTPPPTPPGSSPDLLTPPSDLSPPSRLPPFSLSLPVTLTFFTPLLPLLAS